MNSPTAKCLLEPGVAALEPTRHHSAKSPCLVINDVRDNPRCRSTWLSDITSYVLKRWSMPTGNLLGLGDRQDTWEPKSRIRRCTHALQCQWLRDSWHEHVAIP